MVKQFYHDVARLPQISDQEMSTAMQQLSIQQNDEFDTISALKELYIYVTKYNDQVSNSKYLYPFLDEWVSYNCSNVTRSKMHSQFPKYVCS